MPPPLQSRITWLPRLSARKRWAVDSCRMGLLIKVRVIIIIIIIIIILIVILQVILHYDRPHWRLAGLSGELVSTGTVCITFDDSAEDTEDAEGGGGAALVAFVGGDPAVRAADLGEAELVAEVVEHLGSTLGSWAHMYTGAGDHGPLVHCM